MKRNVLVVFALLMSVFVLAQSTAKIKGIIISNEGKSIPSATVELLKSKDSMLVKVTVCNNEGKFEIENVNQGSFFIRVSAVGHKNYEGNFLVISKDDEVIDLHNISLQVNAASLKEVKVSAKKPFIEQKLDKTILNVESSINSAGSSVLEVLEKAPGVTVDKDGNISLKGKKGVMVMMDGKPTYLNGESLVNYLRSLPSTAIEQIEIMTNPPAKYDAAGNSGIINIKTKKNKMQGFNGNLSMNYGQGRYWKTSNSLNLNYRNKKWNLFSNFNIYRWSGFNDLYITRNFFVEGTNNVETIFDQHAYFKMVYPGIEAKVGADYTASKKTTIGIVMTGFSENGKDQNTNTSYIKNSSGHVNSIVDASNLIKPISKNFGLNLNMRHQYDSTGRELSADADYLFYDLSTSQMFENKFYDASWSKNREDENIKGDLPSVVKIYSFKTDYTHPLKKNAKIGAGVKTSFVKTDNDARYFLVRNGIDFPDERRTNHFVYDENINAGYINLNKQIKKWELQVGLRAENTNAKGKQFRNDSSFTRNYSNIFPTVYINYTPVEKHQIAVSFGRRIERPAYQDLNPFRYFLDPYTYQEGNPFLRPQFSYNYELSHTYKGMITTTLNYTKTTDIFAETLNQIDKDTITYVYKENISKSDNLGIALSANFPVTKWWNTSLYTNVYYNRYHGFIHNQPLDVEATTLLVNMNNQFHFNKGWSAEVGGFARTKGIEGQIIIFPLGQLNLGLQKQILDKKASIKLSVKDLLYTMPFEGSFEFHNIDVKVRQPRDSRVVNLTFTYRFGKNGTENHERRSGAQDEQNRVKKGGSGN